MKWKELIALGLFLIGVGGLVYEAVHTYVKIDEAFKVRHELYQQIDKLSKDNEQLRKALDECKGSNSGIRQSHLKGIINSVLAHLGEKNTKDWTRLLCLTIATESNMGQLTKQIGGPARGITQVEPSTEKETLAWLSKHQPKVFEALKKLRVPARITIHEAEYNIAYSVGLAYGVYRMRKVDPSKKSAKELAKLYKKYYNTYKGKATVDGVMTKLLAHNVNI